MNKFDVVVIGAGPGGYVAAIKSAQHGKRVALVEKAELGGVCLNWGCIPTKALIKSAEVFNEMQHADAYGLSVGSVTADFEKIIARSRGVAAQMEKGVDFLMRKNGINVIKGAARFISNTHLEVTDGEGATQFVEGDAIIIAAGHKPRTFPNLPIDGDKVFHYRKAMTLESQPKSLLCIGAGAIGMEFAYFYNAIGTEVHVVEVADQVLPLEDGEVAKVVERSFSKQGVNIHTGTMVTSLDVGDDSVTVNIERNGKADQITVDKVLVAVGMLPASDHLGLEDAGIETDERGFVVIDEYCRTSAAGVYAIGDIAGRQLLAHKASYEAEIAAAHIGGHPTPANYDQVPACTYCQPQVASVGLSEAKAKEQGYQVKTGRFNFTASGKAQAIGAAEGFVKLVFDAATDGLLGAHLVGAEATELLGELGLALRLESTAQEIIATIHAHPTLSESVMEAAADALGEAVHQ